MPPDIPFPPEPERNKVFLCRSHPDFHIPGDVDVGDGFDGEAYAKRLKACGCDAVAFFAKCHYGHSYYDTQTGIRHPRLKKDMLAEVVKGCRKYDIGVIAYFSVFLSTVDVEKHPEWAAHSNSKLADAGFDSGRYRRVCVNSPFIEEMLLPQCAEVAADYDVDEIFLDTMASFQPCYCPHCRAKFGRDIPETPEDEAWLDYVRWFAGCYAAFHARAPEVIHKANPNIAVIFNWKWGIREPEMPPPHIGRLAADLIPSGMEAAKHCRYFAGTDLPFDYMTGRFLHGLGDWNNNTPESLLYTAAATAANGGSFYLIDRQLPDGRLEERAYGMMAKVFGFLQERREYLTNASHAPEIGILYNYHSAVGPNLEYFARPEVRKDKMKSFEGALRLFVEHGRHFTFLNAERLPEIIHDYRLIVIPEQEHLPAAVKTALKKHVQNGGRLLCTQCAASETVDKDILDLAGVLYQGHSELEYGYFDWPEPILARGRFAEFELREGTQTLCRRVAPLNAGDGGKRFGHGFAPPAAPSDPLVTIRKVGQGEVIYAGAPVFYSYLDHQNPALAQLVLSWVDRLLPEPLVRITAQAQVELAVMRKGDDLLLHLVNHAGKERLGNFWHPVTEYIPEIGGIPASLKLPRSGLKILSVPSRKPLSYEEKENRAHFIIPSLHILESLLVPGYFSP